jgi:putative sigma-54 modulation protein
MSHLGSGLYTTRSLYIVHCLNAIVMNVNIQSVRFTPDVKLIEFVNKKLEKLDTFHDRIIKVDVYLKLDNVVHNIKDKVAEIRVQIPRHQFFVKSSSKSFEESFDNALDSLVNQVKRKKQKQAA